MSELWRVYNSMLDRPEAATGEESLSIMQAQEEEHRRIVLELHEETGQNIPPLLVHIELLNQRLQHLPEETRAQLASGLQDLTRLTQGTLENVRVLAQQLRPSVLDDLGMVAALRWLAGAGRQPLRLAVSFTTEGLPDA